MDDEATAAAAAAAGDENEAAGASRAEDGEPDQGGAESAESAADSGSAADAEGATAAARASGEDAPAAGARATGARATTINPISRWEETIEIEGLTLYDIHREPRRARESDKVTCAVRSINSELTCPVCLGILRKTMIVMECLHRFCSECIQKCLRVGKNECPSCRIHVPSRRSLRADTNFDALIRAM